MLQKSLSKLSCFCVFCFALCTQVIAQERLLSAVYSLAKSPKEKKVSGFKQALAKGQTVDFEPYSLHYTTVKPGMLSHEAHSHSAEELLIIKEGLVKVTIDGQVHHLQKGDVAIIAPHALHGIQNIGKKPCSYLVMLFTNKNQQHFHKDFTSKIIRWNDTEFKKHDLGGRRNFFDGPTGQCKRFEMHTTTLLPGKQSHAPHTHRAAEILIPIEGKTEEHIDGQWYKAKTWEIIYLESMVPHALRNSGKKPCSYYAFQFE